MSQQPRFREKGKERMPTDPVTPVIAQTGLQDCQTLDANDTSDNGDTVLAVKALSSQGSSTQPKLMTLGEEAEVEEVEGEQLSCGRRFLRLIAPYITLRLQMAIIVGIPITCLIAVVVAMLVESVRDVREADSVLELAQVLEAAHLTLTEAQRERGRTGALLNNATNMAVLGKQRDATDVGIDTLVALEGTHQLTNQTVFKTVVTDLSALTQHRQLIDDGKLEFNDALSFYTQICDGIVKLAWAATNHAGTAQVQAQFTRFAVLTALTEHMGLSRPVGTALLVNPSPGTHLIFVQRASKMDMLIDTFSALAGTDFGQTLLQDQRVDMAFQLRDRLVLRDTVQDWATTGGWWDNMTAAIDGVNGRQAQLMQAVRELTGDAKARADAALLWASLGIAVATIASVGLAAASTRSASFTTMKLEAEIQHRRFVEKAIANFVPKQFLTLLGLQDIGQIRLGVRSEEHLTIMFSDVVGWTERTERMTTTQAFDWILQFTETVSPHIKRHAGFIDKYLGDGILALFSISQSAVQCAIDMQVAVAQQSLALTSKRQEPVAIGIGIHTGVVCVGIIGDKHRFDSTIIGDPVNLASRLEGLTRQYGANIIISDTTYQQTDMSQIAHRSLGRVKVKGRKQAEMAWEVFQADAPPLKARKAQTLAQYKQAQILYENGRFGDAERILGEVSSQSYPFDYMDGAVLMKMRQVKELQKTGPPKEWNGEEVLDILCSNP